jgi:alanyl-tRNA synthetase
MAATARLYQWGLRYIPVMLAAEIRKRFLDYFARNGHAVRPSSSLVPADDPTLLFTNAGMVQFKKIFLGLENPSFGSRRATTSQKCVRAGGKHNDLEQVGHTYRHHTFFEMLGNFSFGDYFKREAITFGWEFVTKELGIDPKHVRVTVHYKDDESRALWKELTPMTDSRIYGLSDKDNFWQMADTGPCGPCSEIYVDLAHMTRDWVFPPDASGEWTERDRKDFSTEAFVEGAEAGRFLEIWNLVFMQYDRQADGTLVPLPKPSVDTGAGLDRIAAALQGVTSNYHNDMFVPLLAEVERAVGLRYPDWPSHIDPKRADANTRLPKGSSPASFRVLAEHGRAVAFLIADGVAPSNEGRGYVLRRILRRGVRHAWLLGRRQPTLAAVSEAAINTLGGVYPELKERKKLILETVRREEEAFFATIEGGLARFESLAPVHTTQGSTGIRGTISGEDAFKLYDTFGFPIDLTELMARERGYTVDIQGFEAALDTQRKRSQDERKARKLSVGGDDLGDAGSWELPKGSTGPVASFVGYDSVEIESQVTALRRLGDDRVAVLLEETPFYAESGGQISDQGEIVGDGWKVAVEDVRKIEGRPAAVGRLTGTFKFGRARATVPSGRRRDTERNHTATHLLHAALRKVLGEQVHQAGSLVAPDRLRFDFTHHGPIAPDKLEQIEAIVNEEILKGSPVTFTEMAYPEARARGAMALFGEKYGDVVRVVDVPGVSMELCGGTHVRNTSLIGLFKIVQETGVAAGVRRIEAVTGPGAYAFIREEEKALHRVAEALKTPLANLERRVQTLLDERRALEKRVEEVMRGGGDQLQSLFGKAEQIGDTGAQLVTGVVRAGDVKELQTLGDAIREKLGSGVGVVGASFEDGKNTLIVVVSDDLRERGLRADALIKDIAAAAGGRGGGKAHLAQAGIPDAGRFGEAFAKAPGVIAAALNAA